MNNLRLEIDTRGIATLILDTPDKKVNLLTQPMMEELDHTLDRIAADPAIKGVLVTSAKSDNFIAGADIHILDTITDEKAGEAMAEKGQAIFRKLESLRIPVVAAIHGSCAGGGMELALACHYRIASDDKRTKMGCPEVNLGILPGFGGTQRFPRLMGLQKGLEMVLTGKLISAKEAKRKGLVDRIAPVPLFAEASKDFLLEILAGKKPEKRKSSLSSVLLESNPIGQNFIFSQARKALLKRTKGHYPAPERALMLTEKTFGLPLEEGLKLEACAFGVLVVTKECKNLISLFFLQDEAKKSTGSQNPRIKPQPVNKVGIIGTGVMGTGIAHWMVHNDIPVRIKCVHCDLMGSAYKAVSHLFQETVKRKKLTPKEAQRKMYHLSMTDDYSGFGRADLCIEAAFEDLELKKELLRDFEQKNTHGIFATNTSSLSVSDLAQGSMRPENVAGLHFFNPVSRMPLVEVVRGSKTDETTLVTLVALVKKIGKTPLVVKDSPGFLVNRILMPYLNEAALVLEEGASIQDVDQVMLKFGMPMGPLELIDEVGADIAHKVAGVLHSAFSKRMMPSYIFQKLVDAKRLGKKSGKGLYIYQGKEHHPDEEWIKSILVISPKPPDLREMEERMLYAMINEAARVLEEGVVARAGDVDLGMILGTGFPPFRGGLLKYADDTGLSVIADRLTELSRRNKRFEPCAYLKQKAEAGNKFYEVLP